MTSNYCLPFCQHTVLMMFIIHSDVLYARMKCQYGEPFILANPSNVLMTTLITVSDDNKS